MENTSENKFIDILKNKKLGKQKNSYYIDPKRGNGAGGLPRQIHHNKD